MPLRRLLSVGLIFALAGFGALYFFTDGVKLLEAAASISWVRVLVPVIATLLSYVLMALSYEGIAAATGSPIGIVPMIRITFVSNTVNYLVATGGLSGFAVRMYFFRQSGIPMGRAVTISFVQGLLTNVSLLVFLVMGFYFLLVHESLGGPALVAAAALLAIFVTATVLSAVFLLRPRLRRRTLRWITERCYRVAARVMPANKVPDRTQLLHLEHNIDHGFGFLLTHWRRMIVPTAFILLDWVITLVILWGCFFSVGLWVPPALITVGFAVAILSSMVSLAPAGLGIMESLTTALFATLGTPLAETVIALLLFRLTYYALPFAISLVFFRTMLRDASRHSDDPIP